MKNLIDELTEEQKEALQEAKEAVQERMQEGEFSYSDIEEIMLDYGFEMDYIMEIL